MAQPARPSSDQNSGFGQRLRSRRRELGLTQEELAELAGCSVETVKKAEGGRLRPSRSMAEALASALGLGPAEAAAFVQDARQNGAPATAGVARTTTPNNLPQPPTALVGREAEVATVSARLREDGVRLLTLTGVGGTGKTRLALEVAVRLFDDFPDGVYFVNLAPLADPALMLSACAGVLGVREAAGQKLITRLSVAIGERRILLILDNFEHLGAAAPQVAELLAGTSGLKLLVTSREALRLRGEKEFLVPPLDVPAADAQISVAMLSAFAASALFLERALDVRPDLALTEDTAQAIAAICRRLDGLPLAIELGAARSRVFTPRTLLTQLQAHPGASLEVIAGGPRDLPERQQTLQNTIDWSFNLLAAETQALLRRLAVFVGGCSTAAAEAICGDGSLQSLVLTELVSLVEKHLLRHDELASGESRFWMLATIREFALRRLAESGEEAQLRKRHALYYLALAEHNDTRLSSGERLQAMAVFASEEENMRAALEWLLHQHGRLAAEQALRMATALKAFWNYRSRHVEASGWLQTALDRYPRTTNVQAERIRARAICEFANLANFQRDQDRDHARALLAANLPFWRELGDKKILADALTELSSLTPALANDVSFFDECIALARQSGDQLSLAGTLFWTSYPLAFAGAAERARAMAEESVQLFTARGDRWAAAMPLAVLGHLAARGGDLISARRHYEAALPLLEEAGDSPGQAVTLVNLGRLAYMEGDLDRAQRDSTQGLLLWRRMGDPLAALEPLYALALVAREQGDYASAHASLHEYLSLALDAEALEVLAGVEVARARREDAACARQAAARAARLLGIAQALPRRAQFPLYPPLPKDETERHLTECRAQLDAAAWTAAWLEGRALPLDEARAYVLSGKREG